MNPLSGWPRAQVSNYGTEVGPRLKCSQVLAAFRGDAKIEAQNNPPDAVPSGSCDYWWMLRRGQLPMVPGPLDCLPDMPGWVVGECGLASNTFR